MNVEKNGRFAFPKSELPALHIYRNSWLGVTHAWKTSGSKAEGDWGEMIRCQSVIIAGCPGKLCVHRRFSINGYPRSARIDREIETLFGFQIDHVTKFANSEGWIPDILNMRYQASYFACLNLCNILDKIVTLSRLEKRTFEIDHFQIFFLNFTCLDINKFNSIVDKIVNCWKMKLSKLIAYRYFL